MVKDSDIVTISFKVDASTAQRFKEIVRKKNRTRSIVLRDYVNQYVNRNNHFVDSPKISKTE